MKLRNNWIAGSLCLALSMLVGWASAADMGGDCATKAAMGLPCAAGDIDNSQIMKSGSGSNQNGLSLHPNTQLSIPNDQSNQTGQGNFNTIRNNQVDPLLKSRQDGDLYPLMVRQEAKQSPTQFQNLVQNITGKNLPIFGQDMFDTPAMFNAAQNIPVTSDYVVGPGDEILVRAWGQVDIDYHAVIDRNGILSIPKVGSINVSGVKYDQLQSLIKSSIGRIYNNFDVTVTLGQLRALQVFVVGQVRHPGTYTMGPMSTLVNAVYLAGGPSASGSMRHIELKRGSQVVAEFDFYDLFLKGDKTKDLRLQTGDVIYVQAVGPQVAISGSVNAAAVFEAREGESLKDLVGWAGGFSTTAQTQKISLQRNLDGAARQVQEIDAKTGGLNTPIKAGDVAIVYAISPQIKNSVTLRGNIAESRHFAWHEGLRIHDLIPDREALITKDYWLNKNSDLLPEPSKQKDELRTLNDVTRTLSEINWDYAVVERLDRETLTTTLVPFALGRAVIDADPENNLLLESGDVITVFSKQDMAIPIDKRSVYVRLEGEFAHGGLYKIKQGETLRQVVTRLGGLTKNAYLLGTELHRESLRLEQQKVMDAAVAKAEADLTLKAGYTAQNALSPDDAAAAKANLESQTEYLKKLKQVKATGRLVFNLPENATVADLPNTVLQDGDVVNIPPAKTTVTAVGELVAPNSFLYTPGAKVSDYLSLAGGLSENGDKDHFYVVHVSGVAEGNHTGFFTVSNLENRPILPGDQVVVPPLAEKVSFMKNFKDISQIFYQFGLGAAAVRVLTK